MIKLKHNSTHLSVIAKEVQLFFSAKLCDSFKKKKENKSLHE